MHRNYLLSLLDAYTPTNPEECVYKQHITTFIQEHPNCFERTLALGHITASSWLLNNTGDKYLLMHHAKLNKWVQLGGHCDGDSNVLAVAIKEAQEESGIKHITAISPEIFDIDIHLIPHTKKEAAHYHYDIRFLLQVTSDEPVQINHESTEIAWFSDHLPTDSDSIVRMYRKWHKLCEKQLIPVLTKPTIEQTL